jgi:hypothetical protein
MMCREATLASPTATLHTFSMLYLHEVSGGYLGLANGYLATATQSSKQETQLS